MERWEQTQVARQALEEKAAKFIDKATNLLGLFELMLSTEAEHPSVVDDAVL